MTREDKGKTFTCPACETRLSLAFGEVNAPHFRHTDRTEQTCIPERYTHLCAIWRAKELLDEHLEKKIPFLAREKQSNICFRFATLKGACTSETFCDLDILHNATATILTPSTLKWAPTLFIEYNNGEFVHVRIDAGCPTGQELPGPFIIFDVTKSGVLGIASGKAITETAKVNGESLGPEPCSCESEIYAGFAFFKSNKKWAGLKTLSEWNETQEHQATEFVFLGPRGFQLKAGANYVTFFQNHEKVKPKLPRSCTLCRNFFKESGELICQEHGLVMNETETDSNAANCTDYR
jgi:hypothetical protein